MLVKMSNRWVCCGIVSRNVQLGSCSSHHEVEDSDQDLYQEHEVCGSLKMSCWLRPQLHVRAQEAVHKD